MQLAQKKVMLDKCPYVSDDAKGALESASEPPIRLVTIGTGDNKVELGNETVMFRHDEKFYHPTAVSFLIEDTETEDDIKKAVSEIKQLNFERVGQKISVNLVVLKGSAGDESKFLKALNVILQGIELPVVLLNDNTDTLKKALDICKDKKPLIGFCTESNLDKMTELASSNKVPVIVSAESLEALAGLVQKVKGKSVKDIILYTGEKSISKKIWDLTEIRRMAIKKAFRPFGYPTLVFSIEEDLFQEAASAASFVAKYAGICVMKHRLPWQVLSVLTARQNIFTDPQKPLQVEPKVYQIGNVTNESPILVTTNFSLTYYTVEAEVEASKTPAYIVSCDAEGMSVLTAWAAEKFTSESIAKALSGEEITGKVSHKSVIIPGYVAVLAAKLQDESGWKVTVGPREASGLPSFLRNLGK